MALVSVVIPCYNEEDSIQPFLDVFMKETEQMSCDFEWWFINDGSTDQTLACLRQLAQDDSRIHYLSFSRNFGKEAGILAGLRAAQGDYVVMMDVDLQDPPALLPKMFNRLTQNPTIDCVATFRKNRKGEKLLRSFLSNQFYATFRLLSQVNLQPGARDYRLMTRQMVDAILSLSEYNRFSKGIFQWVGFETEWMGYENLKRKKGHSKWNLIHLFSYSFEGIMAFSTAPLIFASLFGAMFTLLSFIAIGIIVYKTLRYGDPVPGWPSLACSIFFVGGIQLFSTGILGQYLAKTYLETKQRPIYIIKEQR